MRRRMIGAGADNNLFDNFHSGIANSCATYNQSDNTWSWVSESPYSVWSGTAAAFYKSFNWKANKRYRLSWKNKAGTSGNTGFCFKYSDGTSSYGIRPTSTDWVDCKINSTAGKTVVGISIAYGINGTWFTKDILLEEIN